jgi:hypothetical protein
MPETLNTSGFLITEVAGAWAVLKADFGNGYQAGALVGAPAGTRTWLIRIETLPGPLPTYAVPLLGDDPRAAYLWKFYQVSKATHDAPFWFEVEDPATGARLQHLASFTDHTLTYQMFCAHVYGTGLNLRERRLLGVVSPITPPPV